MSQRNEKGEKFVGIDASNAVLDTCIWPEKESVQVTNDEVGIKHLPQRLAEILPTLIVFEATGGLERRAVGALSSAPLPEVVINPRQARDFAKATEQLAQTDAVDAAILAQFGTLFARKYAR